MTIDLPDDLVAAIKRYHEIARPGVDGGSLAALNLVAHIGERVAAIVEANPEGSPSMKALQGAYRDPMCVSGHVPDCDCGSPPGARR